MPVPSWYLRFSYIGSGGQSKESKYANLRGLGLGIGCSGDKVGHDDWFLLHYLSVAVWTTNGV